MRARALVVVLLGSGAPLVALGSGAISPPRRAPLFGRLFKGLGLFNRTSSSSSVTPAGCVDSDAGCKEWAEQGECKVNPTFMHDACAKSCGMCARVVNPSPARRKGCVDEDGYGCPDRAASGECDSDKGEMLYRCPLSCHVCNYQTLLREALGCEDTNQNCAMWAQSGECKANPNYMMENCAVSCTACEAKRKSCDRPPETPPTVRKGDINATMVRILRDFPQFAPKALSWPGGPKGAKAPWVVSLENFITAEEAHAFQDTCQEHFSRSLAGDQLSPVRTSDQCWCSGNECERQPMTTAVAHRIANVTRTQVRYMEPFQVVRYEPGQFYRVHHDQNSGLFTPQGPRVYTFFMYLSTPEAGGGTRFTDLGITVPAVKGNAVLWPSVQDEDPERDEPLTHHEALPVEVGRKFASNVWIHQYDYKTPSNANCLLTHKNTH